MVLDRGHLASFDPVDVGGDLNVGVRGGGRLAVCVGLGELFLSEHHAHLEFGPVGEPVVAHSEV